MKWNRSIFVSLMKTVIKKSHNTFPAIRRARCCKFKTISVTNQACTLAGFPLETDYFSRNHPLRQKQPFSELVHETETDSDTENRLEIAKGDGANRSGELGVWDQQMQTSIHRMDKQILYCTGNYIPFNILYSVSAIHQKLTL